ncbi:hypothetical protein UFOVP1090_22 [uncultured Caudovirales phage]|uniref:Uncharacterized protein n=1 Tax=uncultured Caudovirales phage TaxID=2100421 RepID=A0A6J5QSY2_9CAUD|nr:hypothetical protein UFOVP1090_22 [uncultured Caudovirales phage]
MIQLIANLIRLASLYLEWRLASFPEEAHIRADETEDEINRLRDLGTAVATDRADRLLARLARRRGFAQTLPVTSVTPSSEPVSPDAGRDLHATGN